MIDRQAKNGNVSQEQLDEFLANGGKITQCPPGQRTENIDFKGGFYGKKKKNSSDADE